MRITAKLTASTKLKPWSAKRRRPLAALSAFLAEPLHNVLIMFFCKIAETRIDDPDNFQRGILFPRHFFQDLIDALAHELCDADVATLGSGAQSLQLFGA